MSHFWNARYDIRTGYSGHQLLDLIQEGCNAEGDFPWGVAYHPYPQTLWSPESWLDSNALPDKNTPLITFRNIEVLNKWAERNRYGGKPRSIILSEQNPATKDYSEESQQLQAASLAYVWRKLESCDNIEAYIAHSWIDAHFEGGLKTGLRKYPDDPDDPCGKKLSWYVMRDLGTEKEQSIMEKADETIKMSMNNDIRF